MLTNNIPDLAVNLALRSSDAPMDEMTIMAVSRQANKATAPYMFIQFALFGMLGGVSSIGIGLLQGKKTKGQQEPSSEPPSSVRTG